MVGTRDETFVIPLPGLVTTFEFSCKIFMKIYLRYFQKANSKGSFGIHGIFLTPHIPNWLLQLERIN
jgi:hypothetical protein